MKKALITGGSGFIGTHLAEILDRRGYEITLFDIDEPVWKPEVETFRFLRGSILYLDNIQKAFAGQDVVFDCAGILGSAETFDKIEETVQTNITGTLNGLRVSHELGMPFIYMSLKSAWLNPYMITKRAGTRFCQMYHAYLGHKTAVIQGMNAYGERQKWGKVQKIVPTFVIKALKDETLEIFGDGKQIIDQIYVKDLAEMMVRIYEKELWGEVIDGGTGVPVSVNELAELTIKLTDSRSEIKHIPMRIGEPPQAVSLADPTKARQLLDYYPATPLEEGMRLTIKWYKEHV